MTSQQIRACAAAGVLAGGLGICGCGAGDAAPTTSTAAAASKPARTAPAPVAAALPDGLSGSWRRTMRDRDWEPVGGGFPTGRWRVAVDEHGGASVYQPGIAAADFDTRFVVKGRRLTIAGVPVCPGQKGTYTWRLGHGSLTLRVVDDACKPRVALFGGTWTSR